MRRLAAAAAAVAALASFATPAAELALVLREEVALQPAPRERVPPSAFLWPGEIVEVRGEALEYLRVYDYRRERGGYVRASALRRIVLRADEAPALLAVLRFLRDVPGSEALGIGFAAVYFEVAPAEVLNGPPGVEALDALGILAARLAARASRGAPGRAAQRALAAHLDVAARHGVKLAGYEHDGRVHYCYEGSAWRRVLAMDSGPAPRARAALELTRPECTNADLGPAERRRLEEWRADVLDQVDASRLAPIPRNQVLVRRAAVWAGLAYRRAREGDDPRPAAARAQQALADVRKSDLTWRDRAAFHEAAIRVGASRWALVAAPSGAIRENRPHLVARPAASGETCVLLVDGPRGPSAPLARRCTYGLVWIASQTLNPEASALALAVQQTDAWRELWVFRKSARGWSVRVLPPAAASPGAGYAEFAGWVPGGRRMLVAREAVSGGRRTRAFELLRLDSLVPVRHAAEPGAVAGFRRWQDPSWLGRTVSLR